ncbi:MAG: hypothetical protein K2F72_01180, partial [Muribaculaceae bacterium]|nr:hypothetical protein [Muribaculaceae bacterium]
MKKLAVIISLLSLIATSCSRSRVEPQEVAPVWEWFAAWQPGDTVPRDIAPQVAAFMKVMGADTSAEMLGRWAGSDAVRVFSPDVDSVFPSREPVEASLGGILSRAAAEGLDLPASRYAAVVWGRPESIVFCDSVMLVALNHYLGADYPGYSHVEPYRRRLKTPGRLSADMAEAMVATAYPYASDDVAAVLSRLLYEGALIEAISRVADVPAADAMGYTPEEYAWLEQHETALWQSLVARELLYSTLPGDASRLVSPAPSTSILDAEAPGRAGRFLGHRI